MKYEFTLEGLNCAHCAGKIENKIKSDSRFSDVAFNFATKQLILTSDAQNVKSELQQIVDSIEDGVAVTQNSVESNGSSNKSQKVLLIASAVVCATVVIMHLCGIEHISLMALSYIATLVAGYKIFLKGIKSIFKLRLDETTLLTIAVVAAVILGEYTEACAVTVLFALGELLEDIAVSKARRDISKLADIREDYAFIADKNGELRQVLAQDVEIGSEIVIKPYARVPLDGVVTHGTSFVDSSALTGESVPVSATVGSELLSGMINGEHTLTLRTTKLHRDSAATRIIKLVEESAKNKGNTDKLISRFSAIYTPVIIAIALFIAIVPSIITGDYSTWIYRSLVCLVSSCPCAVVISVPLSYYAGIGVASKHGVLIKGGKYIEALSKADVFAFDKTGTLTSGKMTVTDVIADKNYTKNELLKFAASVESMSSHPIAHAIVKYAKERGVELLTLTDYTEKAGFGVSARLGDKTITCGGYDAKLAGCACYVDDEIIGAIKVSDTVRVEAKSVVNKLKTMGIKKIMMLTGDNKHNAKVVADNIGDIKYHAGLLPQDKVELIKADIDNNNTCVFVGDGINDAPVMATSSCAVAMGLGSDAAIESADVVLSSGDLSQLPTAVKISRKTMATVKVNIIFSLLIKAIVIILGAFGIAPMWLAVFADTGVTVLCVLNSIRLLKQ